MAGPLEGIRVMDFSEGVFGPLCAQILGDMGADVIKIERLQGEAFRHGMRLGGGGGVEQAMKEVKSSRADSPRFVFLNRSKRSLAMNATTQQGREIILRLAKTADVALHNFRPGVMERLGLAYKDLSSVNPRIVYCSLYGYGETGPMAHRAGGDLWAQAMGGVIANMGTQKSPPQASTVGLADAGGAITGALGIMLALFARERTGKGQEVTTNLLNVVLTLSNYEIRRYLMEGKGPRKIGRCNLNPPMGVYKAKDREVATMMGAYSDWPLFCKVLGAEHLIDDPRFATDDIRWEHVEELYEELDPIFAQKTAAEWQRIFREHRMRCDPCLDYSDLFDGPHPQVEANDMLMKMQHPVLGEIKLVGLPIKLKGTPGSPKCPPPLLGQHTAEILRELGYSSQEISELEKSGIANTGGFN
ncbi:MAG: CoA transferase [Chloroflexota bacterium]